MLPHPKLSNQTLKGQQALQPGMDHQVYADGHMDWLMGTGGTTFQQNWTSVQAQTGDVCGHFRFCPCKNKESSARLLSLLQPPNVTLMDIFTTLHKTCVHRETTTLLTPKTPLGMLDTG